MSTDQENVGEQNLDELSILTRVANELSRHPLDISIDLPRPIKFDGCQISKLKFKLYPISVGNMYRLAAKIKELPDDVIAGDISKILLDVVLQHTEKLVYIAAVAIQNDADEPREDILKQVRLILPGDLATLFNIILTRLNVKDFINSIILIKGADILNARSQANQKMSPDEPREKIAHGG